MQETICWCRNCLNITMHCMLIRDSTIVNIWMALSLIYFWQITDAKSQRRVTVELFSRHVYFSKVLGPSQSPSSIAALFLFLWLTTMSDAAIFVIFLDSHFWKSARLCWLARNKERSISSSLSVSLDVSSFRAFWELSMMRRKRSTNVCGWKDWQSSKINMTSTKPKYGLLKSQETLINFVLALVLFVYQKYNCIVC